MVPGAFPRISSTPIRIILGFPRANLHRPSASGAPAMITVASNPSYWTSIATEIEEHLRQAIPLRAPEVVFEPMTNIVLAAPKNAAPALCVAACELVGGQREEAIAAASALHIIHSAASTRAHLLHGDERKPKPKAKPAGRNAYGPNIELLMGDGIAPFAFELLARSDGQDGDSSGRILRVIVELTRAAGPQGALGGLYRDVCSDEAMDDVYGWVEEEAKEEAGGLCACGAACGAILGGGSEEEIEKLRRYGVHVGLIQGVLERSRRKDGRVSELVKGLRDLALKELSGFEGNKVELFCNLIDVNNFLDM